MAVAAFSTWQREKWLPLCKTELVPTEAGNLVYYQPLVDGGKFFFKEDFIPEKVENSFFHWFSNVYFTYYRELPIPWENL